MHIFILRANTAVTPVHLQMSGDGHSALFTQKSLQIVLRLQVFKLEKNARAHTVLPTCISFHRLPIGKNVRQSYRFFYLKLYICKSKIYLFSKEVVISFNSCSICIDNCDFTFHMSIVDVAIVAAAVLAAAAQQPLA